MSLSDWFTDVIGYDMSYGSSKFIIRKRVCPVNISLLYFDINLGFVKDFVVFWALDMITYCIIFLI